MESERRVLLAAPRGYCAGVDRAVITVEKALEAYGAPVYVRKEIVHNKHVVSTLEQKGVIFVNETDEVPEGQTVIFSAHGVSPAVHEEAASRSLKTIDATCPLVTKVHHEVRRFANEETVDNHFKEYNHLRGDRIWFRGHTIDFMFFFSIIFTLFPYSNFLKMTVR